ncbi:ATP-binding protein [Actinomadura craniellae]|uniref:ATP-binding protein n=1 Tax=Actinomadura craniellae TaxID=2231787 RepID=A0A365GXS4_9ACTN|nr:ATP-binding protein [Actinomadura craniellae]RAY11644.1 ATP-binding protein [Actinomadura craniellae]
MSDHAIRPRLLLGKLRLPLTDTAPKHARDLVARLALSWGLSDIEWTVKLAVSELVTNAYLHSDPVRGGTVIIDVARSGKQFQVTVHDSAKKLPETRAADPARENGRGLLLVGAETDACGYYLTPFGKAVWFQLAAHWPLDVISAPGPARPDPGTAPP